MPKSDEAITRAIAGKLVRLLRNIRVTERDCQTYMTIKIKTLERRNDGRVIEWRKRRLFGRIASVVKDSGGRWLVPFNGVITAPLAETIDRSIPEQDSVSVRSVLVCESKNGICAMCYGCTPGMDTVITVSENVGALAADSIAEGMRIVAANQTSTRMERYRKLRPQIADMTAGYHGRAADVPSPVLRLLQLLEARKPRHSEILAPMDGVLKFGKRSSEGIPVEITQENSHSCSLVIPTTERPLAYLDGRKVWLGDAITDAIDINPHDVLYFLGERKCEEHLLSEFQQVFTFFGAIVPDKHLELVIRLMSCWVEVEESGETGLVVGDIVHHSVFRNVNERVINAGARRAIAHPALIGISKATQLLETPRPLDQTLSPAQMLIQS
jgi:DNA-directed RNA polymerase subunit beta'